MAEPTKPKARPTRRTSARKPQASRKPPSPPNRVEPGFVHKKLAALFLKTLQDRAAAKGMPISVGELPQPVTNEDGTTGITDDSREPVELLARILAHVGHRIPGLRKVEKRLEGTDARSGIASDLLALAGQLLSRNEEVAMAVAENTVKTAISKDKTPAEPPMPEPHWPDEPGGS